LTGLFLLACVVLISVLVLVFLFCLLGFSCLYSGAMCDV